MTRYKVGGMTCDGCARSVTRAIMAKDPAARVSVDLSSGTVAVEGGLAEEGVRHAVEGAGFDYRGPAA